MSRTISSGLAFPSFGGEPLSHLERRISVVADALGHTLPMSTVFRKDLEMRNRQLPVLIREAVSPSLSHSMGTALQYYQAPSANDLHATFTSICKIIEGEVGRSPSPGQQHQNTFGLLRDRGR